MSRLRCGRAGFTIIEILVATAVLAMLLVVLLNVISHAGTVTRMASDKISAFQSARAAFDIVARNLSQATLNSYWDYDNPTAPQNYLRNSELHFLVGNAGSNNLPGHAGTGQAICFQFPGGVTDPEETEASYQSLNKMLNACGYFIQYGQTDSLPAPFPASAQPRYRYQLMQRIEPAENLRVFLKDQSGEWVDWFDKLYDGAVPVAENIVYLLAWPRMPPTEDVVGDRLTKITGNFSYDSRVDASNPDQPETAHQLPPVVQLTMVVLDEASAARVCTGSSPPTEISGALSGLFTSSKQDDFEADLATLESNLADAGLNFRVFTTMVPLRESKMQ
jgi:uncharacterized protein (TIGR02599 family)